MTSKEGEHSGTKSLLTWLSLVAGGGAAAIPGGAYFLDHAPPLFKASAFLVGLSALAILLVVYKRRVERAAEPVQPLVLLVASVVMFVGYEIGLQYWSVEPPKERAAEESEGRDPIGFGLARWSLTKKARRFIDEPPPEMQVRTPLDLMLLAEGYKHGPRVIWKPWTVDLAGALLLLLFSLSFFGWAWGWGVLARSQITGGGQRSLRRIMENKRHGWPTSISYAEEDGKPPSKRVIDPHMIIESADGVVIRALQLQPTRVVRHFLSRHIVRTESDESGTRVEHTELVTSSMIGRGVQHDGTFHEFLGLVRDVVSDLKVEEWELMRVKAARRDLGIDSKQFKAACARVFAEYLSGYAEDRFVYPEEDAQLVRLASCFEQLGWSPLTSRPKKLKATKKAKSSKAKPKRPAEPS